MNPLSPILVPKSRTDAWGEQLSEQERWEIYRLTKPPTDKEREALRPWLRSYYDDVKPYLASRGLWVPGHNAWYRFLARMRKLEQVRLVANVEGSSETARDVGRATIDFEKAAAAFRGLSVDSAMSGDEKSCAVYANASAAFHALSLKEKELELKARRQQTADDALKLAREKFEAAERRLAAMADLSDAAHSGSVDPARVADEIDRILGRRK